MGTMHLLCVDTFQMPDVVTTALEQTEQLVVEVNLKNEDELLSLQKAVLQQPANYLQQHLSPEQLEEVAERTQAQLNIPLDALSGLRPMIISSLFLETYLDCNSANFSLDGQLVDWADEANKQIIGLETAAWQLSLFDIIPLPEQVDAFYELVTEPEQSKAELQQMAATYLSGNGEKLHQLLIEQDDFMGAQTIILDDRNHLWMEKLPQLVSENASFIAVGAGHLYGEHGLLALLTAQGYQLTPIPVSFQAVE